MNSLVTGGDAAAGEVIRRQLEDLLPACSPSTRLHVLNGLMWYFEHYGAPDTSLELSGQAITIAESVGTVADRAWLHGRAGRSRAFIEDLQAGLDELELGRSIAVAAADPSGVGGIDKDVGIVLQSAGRFEDAIEAFESSQRYLEPLGNRNTTRHTDAEIAFALHRLGRWREADAALERALTPPAIDWGYVVRAYVRVATGRLEEGERDLRRAWPSVEVSQASTSYGPFFTARGFLSLWQGRPLDALEAAEEGLRRIEATENFRWICELSALGLQTAAEAGGPARARAERLFEHLRSRTKPALERGTMFEHEIRGWRATCQEMARLVGDETTEKWSEAVDAWRLIGRPHDMAYALSRRAEAELSGAGAGARERARGPLAEAWQLASEAGARLLVGAVEKVARRARLEAGEESTVTGSPNSYRLTARERDVLALLARGSTDQQIAEALFISPKTASVHVSTSRQNWAWSTGSRLPR